MASNKEAESLKTVFIKESENNALIRLAGHTRDPFIESASTEKSLIF